MGKSIMLYIGTPLYNLQTVGPYTISIIRLGQSDIKFRYLSPSASNVALIRNCMCEAFLSDDQATHLLFIDSDIGGFSEVDVKHLLNLMHEDSEFDIVGMPYPHKDDEHFNFQAIGTVLIDSIAPVECMFIGCGFMMIKKSALLKLKPALPTFKFQDRNITQFFHTDVIDGTYRSEDAWFCYRAREAGLKLYVLPMWNLTHTGSYEFKARYTPARITRE